MSLDLILAYFCITSLYVNEETPAFALSSFTLLYIALSTSAIKLCSELIVSFPIELSGFSSTAGGVTSGFSGILGVSSTVGSSVLPGFSSTDGMLGTLGFSSVVGGVTVSPGF